MQKRHPIRSFALSALVFASTALLVSGPAAAKGKSEWFQYSVSFTCGESTGEARRVAAGEYATAVALFNAGSADVTLRKSIALVYPPAEQAAGAVSGQLEDALAPGTALEVDCEEIQNEFVYATPLPITDHLQGFLVIESDRPLNVEAIYTATSADGGTSIDVERVAERRVIPRPFVRPTQVAICHFPPGNPDAHHTILIDAAALPAHKAHGDTLGACAQ